MFINNHEEKLDKMFTKLTELKRRRHADEELRDYLEENPLATYDDAYEHLMSEGYELSNIEHCLKETKIKDIKSDNWVEVLDQLRNLGFEFNDLYCYKPVQWIDAVRNGKVYEIEMTRFEDGEYAPVSIGCVDDFDVSDEDFEDEHNPSVRELVDMLSESNNGPEVVWNMIDEYCDVHPKASYREVFDYLVNEKEIHPEYVEYCLEPYSFEESKIKEAFTLEVFDKDGKVIDYQAGFKTPSEARGFVSYNDDHYPAGYKYTIKIREAFTKNADEITFPGEDLHSKMCEWCYSTADYYDLQDACEVDETPEEMTWNMSDAELADAIRYTLDNSEEIWYVYTDDDPETSTAREDGKKLLKEYEKSLLRESCANCGDDEDGYNDPETGEPLCSSCYADRCEELEESKLTESADEDEIKKIEDKIKSVLEKNGWSKDGQYQYVLSDSEYGGGFNHNPNVLPYGSELDNHTYPDENRPGYYINNPLRSDYCYFGISFSTKMPMSMTDEDKELYDKYTKRGWNHKADELTRKDSNYVMDEHFYDKVKETLAEIKKIAPTVEIGMPNDFFNKKNVNFKNKYSYVYATANVAVKKAELQGPAPKCCKDCKYCKEYGAETSYEWVSFGLMCSRANRVLVLATEDGPAKDDVDVEHEIPSWCPYLKRKESKITESENWYEDMKDERTKKEGAFIKELQNKHPELRFESQDDICFAYYVYDTNNNYLGKILLDTHYEFIPKRDCPEEIISLFKKDGLGINRFVNTPWKKSKIKESRDITSNGCIRYINSVLNRYDVMINGKSIYDELLDKFKNKCIDCWTEDYNNNNHNQFYDWLKHNTRTIKVVGLHKWDEPTNKSKMTESIEVKGKDLLSDGKVIGEVYKDWVTNGDWGAVVDKKYKDRFDEIYKAVENHFADQNPDYDNGPFIEFEDFDEEVVEEDKESFLKDNGNNVPMSGTEVIIRDPDGEIVIAKCIDEDEYLFREIETGCEFPISYEDIHFFNEDEDDVERFKRLFYPELLEESIDKVEEKNYDDRCKEEEKLQEASMYKYRVVLTQPEGSRYHLTNADKLRFKTREEAEAKMDAMNAAMGERLASKGLGLAVEEIPETPRKPRQSRANDPDYENPYKVGDILYANVGYSSGIPEWFKVIRTTPTMVICKRLDDRVVSDDGYMQNGTKMPVVDRFMTRWGEELPAVKMTVKNSKWGYYASYDRHAFDKWDGNPKDFYTD